MDRNTTSSFDDKDRNSLEKNHTHFLLLDDGKYCSKHSNNETNQASTINQCEQEQQLGSIHFNLETVF